jgi:TonB family protein
MFEKLVVSNSARPGRRLERFFLGTSLTYMSLLTAVLAISIALETPKLADTSSRVTVVAPLPPPGPAGDPGPARAVRPDNANPTRVLPLEDIVRNKTPHPPAVDVRIDQNITDGNANQGDVPGVVGLGGHSPGGGPGPSDSLAPPTPLVVRHTSAASPPAQPQGPIPIPSKVLQGKAIERRVPNYPAIALPIHLQGSVPVEVVIGVDGAVISARAVGGHPILAAAAVEAARFWRFEPTLLNNKPVQVTGIITFVFKLRE